MADASADVHFGQEAGPGSQHHGRHRTSKDSIWPVRLVAILVFGILETRPSTSPTALGYVTLVVAHWEDWGWGPRRLSCQKVWVLNPFCESNRNKLLAETGMITW